VVEITSHWARWVSVALFRSGLTVLKPETYACRSTHARAIRIQHRGGIGTAFVVRTHFGCRAIAA
jgi:hypothetical protein